MTDSTSEVKMEKSSFAEQLLKLGNFLLELPISRKQAICLVAELLAVLVESDLEDKESDSIDIHTDRYKVTCRINKQSTDNKETLQ